MATHRGPTAGIQHVMNRGVDRQRIFFDDADRLEFGRRLSVLSSDYGVETLAYCLMGNHYHLLLNVPLGNLSAAMQHLGSVFVRRTNARVGRDGPMFRSRFHSIPVTSDAYLQVAARYIHRNPLDVAGVRHLADYRWSSYRTYLGLRRVPSFLRTDLLIGSGSRDEVARLAAFTEEDDDRFQVGTLEDLRWLVAFESARSDLRHEAEERVPSPRVPNERYVFLLIRDWLRPDLIAELDRSLAFPSASARRMAQSRARRRSLLDPVLRDVVTRLAQVIGSTSRAAA